MQWTQSTTLRRRTQTTQMLCCTAQLSRMVAAKHAGVAKDPELTSQVARVLSRLQDVVDSIVDVDGGDVGGVTAHRLQRSLIEGSYKLWDQKLDNETEHPCLQDAVNGVVDVGGGDGRPIAAHRLQRSLVQHICQLRAGQPRQVPRYLLQVHVRIYRLAPRVHLCAVGLRIREFSIRVRYLLHIYICIDRRAPCVQSASGLLDIHVRVGVRDDSESHPVGRIMMVAARSWREHLAERLLEKAV